MYFGIVDLDRSIKAIAYDGVMLLDLQVDVTRYVERSTTRCGMTWITSVATHVMAFSSIQKEICSTEGIIAPDCRVRRFGAQAPWSPVFETLKIAI